MKHLTSFRGFILLALFLLCCSLLWSQQESPASSAPHSESGWVLQMSGIGPAKVGMRLSELGRVLHEKFTMPKNRDEQSCFYVSSSRDPRVLFMIEDGRVSRIDVARRGISTERGIQVGDSEKQVLKAYGKALKIDEHAYAEEKGDHYLTLRSGKYALRFGTIGGKVKGFHSGLYSSVQYIEGCL